MASLFRQGVPRQGSPFSGSGSSSSSSVLKTDEVAKWFDAIWTGSGAFGVSGRQSFFSSSLSKHFGFPTNYSASAALHAILFPPVPPWLATICSLCRVVAFLIIAPILFISLLDLAEYAVIRTLGLQRRQVRVKASGSPTQRMHLSPAQLQSGKAGNVMQAPLLSTGAYDGETLLRHRARSLSTASAEAIEEWQRTGGSFARVAEVRQAATSASSSPSGGATPINNKNSSYFEPTPRSSPTMTQSAIGVEGPMGLSDDESESGGPSSPTMEFGGGQQQTKHRKLKRSHFDFTPIEEKNKFQWSRDSFDDASDGAEVKSQ